MEGENLGVTVGSEFNPQPEAAGAGSPFTITEYGTEADWLAARRLGVGASEVADILGLTPYGSYSVWARKLELLPEMVPSERMRWGQILEEPILAQYEREHVPDELELAMCHHTIARRAGSIAQCSPDGQLWTRPKVLKRLFGEPPCEATTVDTRITVVGGVDAKNVDKHATGWGEPGTDQVPIRYWCQCVWSAMVHNAPWWDLAVLRGGCEFTVYRVPHDPAVSAQMLATVAEWWERHVVGREPPTITATNAQARAEQLKLRYPVSFELNEPLTVSDLTLGAELMRVMAAEKLVKAQRAELEALLKDRMGMAEALGVPGGPSLATWKSNKTGQPEVDWYGVAHDLLVLNAALTDDDQTETWDDLVAKHTKPPATPSRVFRLLGSKPTHPRLIAVIEAALPRLGSEDKNRATALIADLDHTPITEESHAHPDED